MEKNCPCCDNHCPVDALQCRHGREHFGISENGRTRHEDLPTDPDEKVIVLLRKCGHFLHHNVGRDGDTASLTNALTAEERSTLEALLEKCLDHWNGLQESK